MISSTAVGGDLYSVRGSCLHKCVLCVLEKGGRIGKEGKKAEKREGKGGRGGEEREGGNPTIQKCNKAERYFST